MKFLSKPTLSGLTPIVLAGLMAASVIPGAHASSYQCDSGPKSEWKSKDEVRAVVAAKGYEVRKIKVEGGCYEVYARKDRQKFEIFVNPATLEIVKIEQD